MIYCLRSKSSKERNYCDQHPTNHFFPLTIEVFGCLDKQDDVFLHDCANAMWNFKGQEGPPLFVLVTFFNKRILIKLQKMQAFFILSRAVVVGVITYQLPPLRDAPFITTANLEHVINC
jgi:hypothetical protein